ncbi:MAG: type VI secretion system baseplate subunit TssE [Acetobacteraceae bacterium]
MSGRGREAAGRGRETARVQLPLLDRLLDDAPDTDRDPPMSVAEAMDVLRRAVRRDLEALLNARRRWRSWPPGLAELRTSAVGFGIPDFTSGAFADKARRESLRAEIEATIRRFEPRFLSVRVSLLTAEDDLDSTLRLRVEALMHAEPAPEPVAFDTLVDSTTADVFVRPSEHV